MATDKLNKGYALLKIIILCIILGLFILGMSVSFAWKNPTNITNQHHLQAIDLCNDSLDELSLLSYTDPNLTVGLHTNEPFLVAWPPNCELKDLCSGMRSYTVSAITEGKQICVIVSWNEKGIPEQEQLYDLITQP